jgi:hypothetical protein
MITCYLQGGLGNQLFQIFTTIAYAIKNKSKFLFSDTYDLNHGSTHRHTYWSTFLSSLRPFLVHINQDTIHNCLLIKEHSFSYSELPQSHSPEQSKMLVGYFQSPKYFDLYKETIFKMIKLEIHKKDIYNKYPLDYENTISLHFRLGDYKKLQDYHPIMTLDYYERAISYILKFTGEKTKVLYFCEDEDIDDVQHTINMLEIKFNLDFTRGGHVLDDWQQMLQMSLCKYNVIANSTFSWWGAYFNTNEEQIVVHPSHWFGPKAKHDIKDLFPSHWISL